MAVDHYLNKAYGEIHAYWLLQGRCMLDLEMLSVFSWCVYMLERNGMSQKSKCVCSWGWLQGVISQNYPH